MYAPTARKSIPDRSSGAAPTDWVPSRKIGAPGSRSSSRSAGRPSADWTVLTATSCGLRVDRLGQPFEGPNPNVHAAPRERQERIERRAEVSSYTTTLSPGPAAVPAATAPAATDTAETIATSSVDAPTIRANSARHVSPSASQRCQSSQARQRRDRVLEGGERRRGGKAVGRGVEVSRGVRSVELGRREHRDTLSADRSTLGLTALVGDR